MTMPTRRALLFAAAMLPSAAPARAQGADAATVLVQKLGRELVAVVNGPGSSADKSAALARIVDRDVDVAGVARFCLGRYWRTATPDQQRDYTALFRRVLINNITGKVGEYAGVTIAVGRGQPRDGGELAVPSTVTRPNNAPNKVDWVVATEGGAPKVVDVVAEGTSMRLTQRSDYSSFLSQHGGKVEALIDALKRQTAG
jgi:phospholipid transport system substrate-binding protein